MYNGILLEKLHPDISAGERGFSRTHLGSAYNKIRCARTLTPILDKWMEQGICERG